MKTLVAFLAIACASIISACGDVPVDSGITVTEQAACSGTPFVWPIDNHGYHGLAYWSLNNVPQFLTDAIASVTLTPVVSNGITYYDWDRVDTNGLNGVPKFLTCRMRMSLKWYTGAGRPITSPSVKTGCQSYLEQTSNADCEWTGSHTGQIVGSKTWYLYQSANPATQKYIVQSYSIYAGSPGNPGWYVNEFGPVE